MAPAAVALSAHSTVISGITAATVMKVANRNTRATKMARRRPVVMALRVIGCPLFIFRAIVPACNRPSSRFPSPWRSSRWACCCASRAKYPTPQLELQPLHLQGGTEKVHPYPGTCHERANRQSKLNHLRHHHARRRAEPGRVDDPRREAAHRACPGAHEGGRDRGRLPCLVQRRLRGGARHRQ